MPGCFSPCMRMVSRRYFHLWHSHGGRLNMDSSTGHVLCVLLLSPNGFIPSMLNANRTFLFSSPKSSWLASKVFHWRASDGCRSFPSFFKGRSSCHVISLAVFGLENKSFRRSITGRYHITKAGILHWPVLVPIPVSSSAWQPALFFDALFLLFPTVDPTPSSLKLALLL